MTTLKDKKNYYKDGRVVYLHEDVKEAVLEFEKYLNDFSITTNYFETKEEYLERILDKIEIKFKEIFGDFENGM
jgi:DNA-binding ferritin-like protein (Dps family)